MVVCLYVSPEMDWRPVQVTLSSPYVSWDRPRDPKEDGLDNDCLTSCDSVPLSGLRGLRISGEQMLGERRVPLRSTAEEDGLRAGLEK